MVCRLIIILLIIFVSGCSGSFSNFSKTDYQYQSAATVLTMADWRQTLNIEDTPWVYETNVIMGKHPSSQTINTYFPVAIAGQWLVTWALPKKYRRTWQMLNIGVEAGYLYNNYQLGITMEF